MYRYVHEKAYILVQAHPFKDDIQLAPLEYIDSIEVFNGCQDEMSRNVKKHCHFNDLKLLNIL